MRAESRWLGTAVGLSVGILAWVVGLGELIWPQHPQWALILIIIAVALVSAELLERSDRRRTTANPAR